MPLPFRVGITWLQYGATHYCNVQHYQGYGIVSGAVQITGTFGALTTWFTTEAEIQAAIAALQPPRGNLQSPPGVLRFTENTTNDTYVISVNEIAAIEQTLTTMTKLYFTNKGTASRVATEGLLTIKQRIEAA